MELEQDHIVDLRDIVDRMKTALSGQDGVAYVLACQDGGFAPEDEELYARGSADMDREEKRLAEEKLERLIFANMKGMSKPRRRLRGSTKFDFWGFGRDVDEDGNCQPYNVLMCTERKRELLVKFGVDRLKVSKDETIPIGRATPSRVGQTFQTYYKGYQRRVSDQ
jgi:hypothetical protein